MGVDGAGAGTVASSNKDKLEIKISKMVQYLVEQGHVVYSIDKYEDKTERRKYRASVNYWILKREKLNKEV